VNRIWEVVEERAIFCDMAG